MVERESGETLPEFGDRILRLLAMPRRSGVSRDDYELERAALLAALPPAHKARLLANRLRKDEGFSESRGREFMKRGERIDKALTQLESGNDDFGAVEVIDNTGAPSPDEALMMLEEKLGERRASVAGRELPANRPQTITLFLDWVFDRGFWDDCGAMMQRVYGLTWAAFPYLLDGYDDKAIRLLVENPDDSRRRSLFHQDRVKRMRLNFNVKNRKRERAADVAEVCRMGLGSCVTELDLLEDFLRFWFEPAEGRKHWAPPSTVIRRVLVTGYAVRPDLVQGKTLKQLAAMTGQGAPAFVWLLQKHFRSRGFLPANSRRNKDDE